MWFSYTNLMALVIDYNIKNQAIVVFYDQQSLLCVLNNLRNS